MQAASSTTGLECSVGIGHYNDLNHAPKFLPCCHSCCLKCAKNLSISQEEKAADTIDCVIKPESASNHQVTSSGATHTSSITCPISRGDYFQLFISMTEQTEAASSIFKTSDYTLHITVLASVITKEVKRDEQLHLFQKHFLSLPKVNWNEANNNFTSLTHTMEIVTSWKTLISAFFSFPIIVSRTKHSFVDNISSVLDISSDCLTLVSLFHSTQIKSTMKKELTSIFRELISTINQLIGSQLYTDHCHVKSEGITLLHSLIFSIGLNVQYLYLSQLPHCLLKSIGVNGSAVEYNNSSKQVLSNQSLDNSKPFTEASVQLFIKSIRNATISIHIVSTSSISDLKHIIYVHDGIPPCDLRLMHRGRELRDDALLSGLDVDGATITCLLRVLGGNESVKVFLGEVSHDIEFDPSLPLSEFLSQISKSFKISSHQIDRLCFCEGIEEILDISSTDGLQMARQLLHDSPNYQIIVIVKDCSNASTVSMDGSIVEMKISSSQNSPRTNFTIVPSAVDLLQHNGIYTFVDSLCELNIIPIESKQIITPESDLVCKLMIVGVAGVGKSRLINNSFLNGVFASRFVGEWMISKQNEDGVTKFPVHVSYADNFKAACVLSDESNISVTINCIGDFHEVLMGVGFIRNILNDRNKDHIDPRNEIKIKKVCLYGPFKGIGDLQDSVNENELNYRRAVKLEIIDTPGFDDSNWGVASPVVESLQEANIVLMVCNGGRAPETRTIEKLLQYRDNWNSRKSFVLGFIGMENCAGNFFAENIRQVGIPETRESTNEHGEVERIEVDTEFRRYLRYNPSINQDVIDYYINQLATNRSCISISAQGTLDVLSLQGLVNSSLQLMIKSILTPRLQLLNKTLMDYRNSTKTNYKSRELSVKPLKIRKYEDLPSKFRSELLRNTRSVMDIQFRVPSITRLIQEGILDSFLEWTYGVVLGCAESMLYCNPTMDYVKEVITTFFNDDAGLNMSLNRLVGKVLEKVDAMTNNSSAKFNSKCYQAIMRLTRDLFHPLKGSEFGNDTDFKICSQKISSISESLKFLVSPTDLSKVTASAIKDIYKKIKVALKSLHSEDISGVIWSSVKPPFHVINRLGVDGNSVSVSGGPLKNDDKFPVALATNSFSGRSDCHKQLGYSSEKDLLDKLHYRKSASAPMSLKEYIKFNAKKYCGLLDSSALNEIDDGFSTIPSDIKCNVKRMFMPVARSLIRTNIVTDNSQQRVKFDVIGYDKQPEFDVAEFVISDDKVINLHISDSTQDMIGGYLADAHLDRTLCPYIMITDKPGMNLEKKANIFMDLNYWSAHYQLDQLDSNDTENLPSEVSQNLKNCHSGGLEDKPALAFVIVGQECFQDVCENYQRDIANHPNVNLVIVKLPFVKRGYATAWSYAMILGRILQEATGWKYFFILDDDLESSSEYDPEKTMMFVPCSFRRSMMVLQKTFGEVNANSHRPNIVDTHDELIDIVRQSNQLSSSACRKASEWLKQYFGTLINDSDRQIEIFLRLISCDSIDLREQVKNWLNSSDEAGRVASVAIIHEARKKLSEYKKYPGRSYRHCLYERFQFNLHDVSVTKDLFMLPDELLLGKNDNCLPIPEYLAQYSLLQNKVDANKWYMRCKLALYGISGFSVFTTSQKSINMGNEDPSHHGYIDASVTLSQQCDDDYEGNFDSDDLVLSESIIHDDDDDECSIDAKIKLDSPDDSMFDEGKQMHMSSCSSSTSQKRASVKHENNLRNQSFSDQATGISYMLEQKTRGSDDVCLIENSQATRRKRKICDDDDDDDDDDAPRRKPEHDAISDTAILPSILNIGVHIPNSLLLSFDECINGVTLRYLSNTHNLLDSVNFQAIQFIMRNLMRRAFALSKVQQLDTYLNSDIFSCSVLDWDGCKETDGMFFIENIPVDFGFIMSNTNEIIVHDKKESGFKIIYIPFYGAYYELLEVDILLHWIDIFIQWISQWISNVYCYESFAITDVVHFDLLRKIKLDLRLTGWKQAIKRLFYAKKAKL